MSQLTTPIPTTEITDVQIQRENAAFEMIQRQAKMFSSSILVPKEFQGQIANCAIAVNIAKRLGADPFMVIQNIDIIHGRPSFRATFLIAMVNASGRFEPLQYRMEGDEGKPNRSCIAWTKSKSDKAVLEGPKITLEMAKAEGWSTKNGSKWITMPELMLRYRAAAFFARLYAPDITLGMMTAEEASDLPAPERDITPTVTNSRLFQTTALPPVSTAEEAGSFALIEQVNELLEKAGLFWPDISAHLEQNGIITEDMASTAALSAAEATDIIRNFDRIAEAVNKTK